jgi:uncharacterized protein
MTASSTLSRRSFLRRLLRASAATAIAGLGGYGYSSQVETQWLAIEEVTLPIPKLPAALEGLRIALLSDFHLYPYTQLAFVREVVERTNALAPDLVVLGGDYVLEDAAAIDDLAPVLASLSSRYGVYGIVGNHDLWTDVRTVTAGFAAVGLPLLRNAGVPISIGASTLYLAGLDDGWSGQPDLDTALASAPPNAPVVVLMHEPDFITQIAADGRVAVQLSGHTHGGQVRLPSIGAPILPRYGQIYDQGRYRVGESWLYTTRGIGVIGPPVRFNCRPEVSLLTLAAQG